MVLAAGDVARERCDRPAWIRGIDHRIEPIAPRPARPHRRRASTRIAAEKAGVADGPVDVAELHAPFSHQELILRDALGLGDDVDVNPSGGALAANPMMAAGLIRIGEVANRIIDGDANRGVAHATAGPCLQQNLVVRPGRRGADGARNELPSSASARPSTRPRAATSRWPASSARPPQRALADAEMTWTDIDAVVIGKAPDFFEGVMMPELFLADALGATGKPLFRVHTAGSVGGSTAIVASQLVQAGIHERVLTVAFEKQSESEAMWALSLPIPFTPPLHAGAGGYFAPHIRSYMRRLEGARPHRHAGGAEGPAERAQEPLRPPARARHHASTPSRTR